MKSKLGLLIFVLAALGLVAYGATVFLSKTEPTAPEAESETFISGENSSYDESTTADAVSQVMTLTENAISNESSGYKYAYAGFNPSYADVSGTQWNLLLVNRDYILPDDFDVDLAPAVDSLPNGAQLDSRVAPHYNEMYLAALEDGIELEPISGYRSVEHQRRNFENKINSYINEGYDKIEATKLAATHILPPGTSEHNAGLAMDICSLYQNFDETEEFAWLNENAADYGFILRYPKNKEDKTDIIYEPWHWRYVGVETAKAVKASGLCYEEYLGLA